MALRETAWRTFAGELNAAMQEEHGTGERAATYLLSPYGARVNRVLMAGILSTPEPIGKDPAQPFWRARLADPTGTVSVTAGAFQPRAMAQLRSVPAPRTAMVVGKVHLYRGGDATAYISVRAEGIRTIEETALRGIYADALAQSLDRLDLVEKLAREPDLPDDRLGTHGAPAAWVRAARESVRRYPSVDRAAYRAALKNVLEVVEGKRPVLAAAAPPPGTLRVTPAEPPPSAPRPAPSAEERAHESAFLDVLDELVDGSSDGYADLKELVQRLAEHGLSAEAAEEMLDRLQEDGVVEEPIVGRLRRA